MLEGTCTARERLGLARQHRDRRTTAGAPEHVLEESSFRNQKCGVVEIEYLDMPPGSGRAPAETVLEEAVAALDTLAAGMVDHGAQSHTVVADYYYGISYAWGAAPLEEESMSKSQAESQSRRSPWPR